MEQNNDEKEVVQDAELVESVQEVETKKDDPYFVLLYKNEEESQIRNISINLNPLVQQMKDEKLADKELNLVMYGFESAFRVMLNNYNLSPRVEPVDSFADHATYLKKINEALDREEAQEAASEVSVENDKTQQSE
jgi:hypothetical protein